MDSKWADRLRDIEKRLDALTTPEADHQAAVDADLSKPLKVEPWQEEPCDPTKPDTDEPEGMNCIRVNCKQVIELVRLREENKEVVADCSDTHIELVHANAEIKRLEAGDTVAYIKGLTAEIERLKGALQEIARGCYSLSRIDDIAENALQRK